MGDKYTELSETMITSRDLARERMVDHQHDLEGLKGLIRQTLDGFMARIEGTTTTVS